MQDIYLVAFITTFIGFMSGLLLKYSKKYFFGLLIIVFISLFAFCLYKYSLDLKYQLVNIALDAKVDSLQTDLRPISEGGHDSNINDNNDNAWLSYWQGHVAKDKSNYLELNWNKNYNIHSTYIVFLEEVTLDLILQVRNNGRWENISEMEGWRGTVLDFDLGRKKPAGDALRIVFTYATGYTVRVKEWKVFIRANLFQKFFSIPIHRISKYISYQLFILLLYILPSIGILYYVRPLKSLSQKSYFIPPFSLFFYFLSTIISHFLNIDFRIIPTVFIVLTAIMMIYKPINIKSVIPDLFLIKIAMFYILLLLLLDIAIDTIYGMHYQADYLMEYSVGKMFKDRLPINMSKHVLWGWNFFDRTHLQGIASVPFLCWIKSEVMVFNRYSIITIVFTIWS